MIKGKIKVKRTGIHAKTKQSANKNSKNYKKRNLSYKNKTRNSLLDESFDLAIKYINEATISCGFDKFNVFFD